MMLALYEKIVAEREAAKKAGASDADRDAITREIIDRHRKEATGQSYANEWRPPSQLSPEADDRDGEF